MRIVIRLKDGLGVFFFKFTIIVTFNGLCKIILPCFSTIKCLQKNYSAEIVTNLGVFLLKSACTKIH